MTARSPLLLLTMLLLLGPAVAGCGDFIEFERTDPANTPTSTSDAGSAAGPDSASSATSATRRGFYTRCAERFATLAVVDDSGYADLLARRVQVDGAGFALVDYAGWSADASDLAALDTFLAALAGATASECDLAFWLNAYNANVLRAVLEASGGSPGYSVSDDDFAFFSQTRYPVAGLMLSLDELEHGVVRGDFRHANVEGSADVDALMAAHATLWGGEALDARVHMALNCAARGCPNLASEPYTGAQLDTQLAAAAGAFLANPGKGAGPNGVTQLFDWFRPDFERDSGSVDEFIRRHREGGLEGVNASAFITYDWSLNIQ